MTYLLARLTRLLHDEGGWLQFLPMIASLAGGLLGKGAQKSAEGRMSEANLLQGQDALRNQQYTTRQNAETQAANTDLQRKNFEENSRGGRAKQALIGQLLSGGGLQDAHINVPGIQTAQVSGGLRPSALGAGGQNVAALLAKLAEEKMQTPESYTGGNVLTPPQLSGIPKASGWEKAAGIGGILGTLGGSVGGLMQSVMQPKYSLPDIGAIASGAPKGLPGEMDLDELLGD